MRLPLLGPLPGPLLGPLQALALVLLLEQEMPGGFQAAGEAER